MTTNNIISGQNPSALNAASIQQVDVEKMFLGWFGKNYNFHGDVPEGTAKHIKTNRNPTAQIIYDDFVNHFANLGIQVTLTPDDVSRIIAAERAKAIHPKKTAIEFINEYLSNSKEWNVSPAWREFKLTTYGATTSKDQNLLKQYLMTEVYAKGLKYAQGEIEAAMSVIAAGAYNKALGVLIDRIKYDPSKVVSCDEWLCNVYEYLKPTQSYAVFKMMLMHWGWQIKRKMLSKPVANHIWIAIRGGHGIGKTTLVKKMCSIFDDFFSATSISKLFEDTKEIKRLTENYVLLMDELGIGVEGETCEGKLTTDQRNLLKSILTGDKIDARVYGTQDQTRKNITFSVISTANTHLYDVIFDPDTMRRFYEFDCTAQKPGSYAHIDRYLDHSEMFWCGIDESLEEGYWDVNSELGKQVSREQAAYYPTNTTTKMWIQACNVKPGTETLETVYRAYSSWCKDTGNHSKTRQNFAVDIKHLLPEAISASGRIGLSWVDEHGVESYVSPISSRDEIDSQGNLINRNLITCLGGGSTNVLS